MRLREVGVSHWYSSLALSCLLALDTVYPLDSGTRGRGRFTREMWRSRAQGPGEYASCSCWCLTHAHGHGHRRPLPPFNCT